MALVCPTAWDRAQLARGSSIRQDAWHLRPYGPDAEADPGAFEVDSFLDRAVDDLASAGVAGVTSSSDYPGCLLAAILAQQLGLPGADPQSLLTSSHKYYARLAQQSSAPESTPAFILLDPARIRPSDITLSFPLFVKPVKSWFSQFARRIDSYEELRDFLSWPDLQDHLRHFVRPFNQLLSRYGSFEYDGGFMLAEQLVSGRQVTLEGFVLDGEVSVLGIVDSFMYPGTSSFMNFVYPSALEDPIAFELTRVTERVLRGLNFAHGLFNIEYMVDREAGSIYIIEVNPRMCGQFADLMESVNGVNTYHVLSRLAQGLKPGNTRSDTGFAVAGSFALRSFTDGLVVKTPARQIVDIVRQDLPMTLYISYYAAGERLGYNQKQFDGWSYRYAVINLASHDLDSLHSDFREIMRHLDLRIDTSVQN